MMENLEKLMEMADEEFGAIVKNGKFKSREEIHSAYELMDIAKDAMEIICMEDDMSGEGMSSRGSYRDGRSNRGSYYEDGSYERRGRGRSRDSRGRFNEGSYRDGSYYREGMMRRGYRDGGKEEFAEELRGLMEEAPDQQTRQQIQQMLQNMGQ